MICVVAQQYKDRHSWPDHDCEFIADCNGATQPSRIVPDVNVCTRHAVLLAEMGLTRFAMIHDVKAP